ncbi:hypothetical protein V9T40_007788 [Parthenolecanium corni]|uniref:DNA polymerase delta small subunit n=1 Tax=Parthenolecanium corni TaxID=536013 RepID=A0AAN9Y6G0_9HEMI
MKENGDQLVQLRSTHDYEDLSGRFRLHLKNYERQFCNIYSVRIVEARRRIEKVAATKWKKSVKKLMDLNNLKGEQCVIVGTLYKNQELKPSVLRDVSKEYQTVPPAPRTHFVSDKDELILEDETQRVTLHGVLDVHSVVTGCVVAVLGKLQPNGVFMVEDYCWPEAEPIAKSLPALTQDKFLVLISGIELATNKNNLSLQLFADWVTGWSGAKGFIDASRLVHVIFAGNCIRCKPLPKPKYGTKTDSTDDIEAVKELDYIIQQLIECIDVDIMPGEFDPTNHTFPQQPLHKCLFPESAQYSTFRSVSNPHACKIENRLVLGSAGEPIADIQRYSNLTDPLDILEKTLDWAHMAPTAPDTLPCYPFDDYDPFLLTERPHVYFAGNQPEFQTKLKKGPKYDVRLVCIPSFTATQSFVLVNLKDLECQLISLNVNKKLKT